MNNHKGDWLYGKELSSEQSYSAKLLDEDGVLISNILVDNSAPHKIKRFLIKDPELLGILQPYRVFQVQTEGSHVVSICNVRLCGDQSCRHFHFDIK